MNKNKLNKILALKVDIDTFRGTREGVPRLIEVLKKYQASATFYFTLGRDNTGRAIKRVFRPGFLSKVSRTSVVEHYGIRTLLYGTLIPGPHISGKCAQIMREVRDAGFEIGIHANDHIKWQDNVATKSQGCLEKRPYHKSLPPPNQKVKLKRQLRNENWTKGEMETAANSFYTVFKDIAHTHAAAGWQMNEYAFELERNYFKFDYCSDTRGWCPFIPIWPTFKQQGDATIIGCPQLPTTIPTLDELIGINDITAQNVHSHVLKLTKMNDGGNSYHVYTLHAELEGQKLLDTFDRLLAGWSEQGYLLTSMRTLYENLDLTKLPYHQIVMGEVPGRSGLLALQGPLWQFKS